MTTHLWYRHLLFWSSCLLPVAGNAADDSWPAWVSGFSHTHLALPRPPRSTATLALVDVEGDCYLQLEVTDGYRGEFQSAGALTLLTPRDTVTLPLARLQMRFFHDAEQHLAAVLLYRWQGVPTQLHAPITAATVQSSRGPQRYAVGRRQAPLTIHPEATSTCGSSGLAHP